MKFYQKNSNALAILCLSVTLYIYACTGNDKKIPDVSDIDVDVKVVRFEEALFALDTNDLAAALEKLEGKYPEFSKVYFEAIMGSKNKTIAPEGHAAYMADFLGDTLVRRIVDTTLFVFPATYPFEKHFKEPLQRFRYYFPKEEVPTITTFFSWFTIGNIIYGTKNDLAVGLDFFLGDSFPYRNVNPDNPNFSAYLTRTFTPEHLIPKTLKPLIQDVCPLVMGNKLIDKMIENGKQLYILDLLLPRTPDSIKLEMTAKQVQWLENNEKDMWTFFLTDNLLYSENWHDIRKYVEYSPTSPGMPAEAPGRTGDWVGWQIVKAYMKRNPETTLPQLIALNDAQQMITKARYKP